MLGKDPNTVEDPRNRSRTARQPEANGRLVDDVRDDVLTVDHCRIFQWARHPGVMENTERERHVVRGERLAVRKPYAAAQVEHELAAIFREFPRLGQRRLHLLRLMVQANQRSVELLGDDMSRVVRGQQAVPRGRLAREGNAQNALVQPRRRPASRDESPDGDENAEENAVSHGSSPTLLGSTKTCPRY